MFTKDTGPDLEHPVEIEASPKKSDGGGRGDDKFATNDDRDGSISDHAEGGEDRETLEEEGTVADLDDTDALVGEGDKGPEDDSMQDAAEGAEEISVEPDEPIVEFDEVPRRPKAKEKSQKGSKGDDALRKPNHQEILQRLLEKNEVILQLNKKNIQLEAKQKSLEEKRLRMTAEFENYRKRTRKEWELLKHQSRAEVVLEILAVVDNFERAFSMIGEKEDDFIKGIRLIYNNLMSALTKFGVSRMDALHEPFDPNFHMAMAQIESKEVESNHVAEVVQNGYMMGDRVIRPAKVVIAK